MLAKRIAKYLDYFTLDLFQSTNLQDISYIFSDINLNKNLRALFVRVKNF